MAACLCVGGREKKNKTAFRFEIKLLHCRLLERLFKGKASGDIMILCRLGTEGFFLGGEELNSH